MAELAVAIRSGDLAHDNLVTAIPSLVRCLGLDVLGVRRKFANRINGFKKIRGILQSTVVGVPNLSADVTVERFGERVNGVVETGVVVVSAEELEDELAVNQDDP